MSRLPWHFDQSLQRESRGHQRHDHRADLWRRIREIARELSLIVRLQQENKAATFKLNALDSAVTRTVLNLFRSVQMVAKVYGRYAPTSDERDRWEKIADQLDAAREMERQKTKRVGETGTTVDTRPQNDSSQPPVSDWLVDSRGGTRTHDPGIMSAVL